MSSFYIFKLNFIAMMNTGFGNIELIDLVVKKPNLL